MERRICYSMLYFLFWAHFDKCVGSEVKLTATPGTITYGLTETFKLKCSLQDTGVIVGRQVSVAAYDIEHVNSIIISRVNPDETVTSLAEIIMSENAKVVGDLETVTVVGTLTSSDPDDPEYLELTWTSPGEEQSGSEVKLTAAPVTITNGLTENLKLRCSLQDTTDASSVIVGRQVSVTSYDIEHVNSIIISRVNSDETVTSLAEIITSENANVLDDLQMLTVDGTLTPGDPADPEYLELTWTNPREEQSGSYICEVNGLDPQGHGVVLQKSMAVNSADPEVKDLVKEFNNLKASLTSQIQDLAKENNELKAIVATHKAPHTEGGAVNCGDSNSWPIAPGSNTKKLIVPVTFKQPYSSPPVISVASVGEDHRLDNTNVLGYIPLVGT